jgi:hypothetical protein
MHGAGARRAVCAVQPPGGVLGVRLGHRSVAECRARCGGVERERYDKDISTGTQENILVNKRYESK